MEVTIKRHQRGEQRGCVSKQKVKIDYYDSWNCDWTLAQIIAPLLAHLKEHKNSFGKIDLEDVPETLHSTFSEEGYSCEAYMWVLDEIIYAMSEIANHKPNEPELYTKRVDYLPSEDDPLELGSLDPIEGAMDDYTAYNARIQAACCLFGKYFQTFWD